MLKKKRFYILWVHDFGVGAGGGSRSNGSQGDAAILHLVGEETEGAGGRPAGAIVEGAPGGAGEGVCLGGRAPALHRGDSGDRITPRIAPLVKGGVQAHLNLRQTALLFGETSFSVLEIIGGGGGLGFGVEGLFEKGGESVAETLGGLALELLGVSPLCVFSSVDGTPFGEHRGGGVEEDGEDGGGFQTIFLGEVPAGFTFLDALVGFF